MSTFPAVDQHVQDVKKRVIDVFTLEHEEKHKEAYIQYLHCVTYINELLLHDAQVQGFHVVSNTVSLIRLAKQCLERTEKLADDFRRTSVQAPGGVLTAQGHPGSASAPVGAYTSGPSLGPTAASSGPRSLPARPVSYPSATMPSSLTGATTSPCGTVADSSTQDGTSWSVEPLSLGLDLPQEFRPAGQSVPDVGIQRRVRGNALEQAERRNQQLIRAYHARLMKTQGKKNQNTTNLALQIQRKLAENMQIAKATEAARMKKLQEKVKKDQQRMLQEAYSYGMSKEEQERRRMYTKILGYEHDTKWLLPWREKLNEQPEDTKLMLEIIQNVLNTQDHPLTMMIAEQQSKVFERINPLVSKRIHLLKHIKVPLYPKSPESSPVKETGTSQSITEGMDTASMDSGHQSTDSHPSSIDHRSDSDPSISNVNVEAQSTDSGKGVDGSSFDCMEALHNRGGNAHGKQDPEDASLDTVPEDGVLPDARSVRSESMPVLPSSEKQEVPDSANRSTSLSSMPSSDSEKPDIPDGSCSSKDKSPITSPKRMTSLPKPSADEQEVREFMQKILLEIQDAWEHVKTMFVVTYEQLNSPEGQDILLTLEEPFFKPIWPYLLPLIRLAHRTEEETCAMVMTRYQEALPGDLGIRPRLCPGGDKLQGNDFPYSQAVTELRKVSNMSYSLSKIECIVNVVRIIEKLAGEYSNVPIGADDLLPVVSYVLIRTKMPQLISECFAMDTFIHEAFMHAMEGYCLTTLLTALAYVKTLDYR